MTFGQFIDAVVTVAIGTASVVLPTFFSHHKKLAAIAETLAKVVEANGPKVP